MIVENLGPGDIVIDEGRRNDPHVLILSIGSSSYGLKELWVLYEDEQIERWNLNRTKSIGSYDLKIVHSKKKE